jgi:hypothetical protein
LQEAKRRMWDGENGESCNGDGEDVQALKWFTRIPHMFCKKLMDSDTTTHGGVLRAMPQRTASSCCNIE